MVDSIETSEPLPASGLSNLPVGHAGDEDQSHAPRKTRRSNAVNPNPDEWEETDEDEEAVLSTKRIKGKGRADAPDTPIKRTISSTSERSSAPGTPLRTPKTGRSGAISPIPTARKSRNITTTPIRRRAPPKPAIPAIASSRVTSRKTPVSSQGVGTTSNPGSSSTTTIIDYLSYILRLILQIIQFIVSLLNILLGPILQPILYTLSAILIITILSYFLLPRLPGFAISLLGYIFRSLSSIIRIPVNFDISDSELVQSLAKIPFQAIVATPSCYLLGTLCSVAPDGTSPWWNKSFNLGGRKRKGDLVDKSGVAHRLIRQGQMSKDVFDSIRAFREDGLAAGMDSVAIWQLGVTVMTGSTLDEKDMIGKELFELGDLTRDLYDDVRGINNKAVDAFTWIQWDLAALHQLLSKPEPLYKSDTILSKRLHNLILKLDNTLADLYSKTDKASDLSDIASTKGKSLLFILNVIDSELSLQKASTPIWKRAISEGMHQVIGGPPPAAALLRQNLGITKQAIGDLDGLHSHLEFLRAKLVDYRDQVGAFKASMLGVHVGTGMQGKIGSSLVEGGEEGENGDGEAVLGVEEELGILSKLVEQFGEAVGKAKDRPMRKGDVTRPRIEGT